MTADATTLTEQSLPTDAPVFYTRADQKYLALQDIKEGIKAWHVWFALAYQDIKMRYRRSVIGPFWITISVAITTYSMGYLYSYLFHIDLQNYFPFLVAGMLAWTLISGTLNELVDTFVAEEGMIKQIKLPYTLYINKIIMRNFLVFLHNIPIIFPIILIFHQTAKVNLNTLMLIPGLFFLYINAISYGLVLSMIGTRFRDMSQIIKSLIQVVFFMTPVMWKPDILPPSRQFLAHYNPFYPFVEFIRDPLMGAQPRLQGLYMIAFITLIGMILCFKMLTRYRARIVYWL